MRLDKLQAYFETSPAMKLLNATNAPYIIDFLHQQFKHASRIAIPHSELLPALAAYQEELQESYPDKLPTKADIYLTDWHGNLWLRRSMGRDEPEYQLTPQTEDVFVFLNGVLDKDLGFVGTESRLTLIIETLSDLAVRSSDDPQVRVAHLCIQKAKIQAEIDLIEAEGHAAKYHPAQIRERFATAVSLLRQLQGDFRAVEESFRDITTQVQQRQIGGRDTRGMILEFALDAEDLLKQKDQGVSFYEFVRLILSPTQTERLEGIVKEIRRIPELMQQQDGLEAIRGMVTLLQNEAEKVMRTNQRLSATLRRLLDARANAERQRIAELLREIQGLAIVHAATPDSDGVGLTLELEAAIDSPFRRTFWLQPSRFETVDLTNYQPDPDERLSVFQRFAAMRHLNWLVMRDKIRQMLTIENTPTLGDLLDHHPAEGGVVEIIGYLQIAAEDGHFVDPSTHEEVIVPACRPDEHSVLVTVPRVTFMPNRRNDRAH